MNHAAISAVAAGFAPVVRDHIAEVVAKAIEPMRAEIAEYMAERSVLMERIAALEAREPVPGPQGERGLQGEPGPQGPVGEPGAAGERGTDGPVGPQGEAGPPGGVGERGEAGPQGERGEPGLAGKDGSNGMQGERGDPGKDGIGLAGAVINREGQLVVTLADGAVHTLGEVVGKDGADGKDGEPGKDGRDGFSLDDFTIEPLDERTFSFGFKQGETTKWHRLRFPVVLDRGVYKRGTKYERGDLVTFGGFSWIARKDNPDGDPVRETDDNWHMAARRGRDGKDGKDGKNGERGPQGEPGLHHFQQGKT